MQKDFQQILVTYQALLSRVAASYEANEAVRQELLQEIALAVWQSLEKFKGDASIKTYILKVAHNRAVTHVCKETRQVPQDAQSNEHEWVGDDENKPDIVMQKSQQMEHLLVAIRSLPIAQRQVVTLAFEGLSYDEIGQVCGLNKNHVGVTLTRAKQSLQKVMNP